MSLIRLRSLRLREQNGFESQRRKNLEHISKINRFLAAKTGKCVSKNVRLCARRWPYGRAYIPSSPHISPNRLT